MNLPFFKTNLMKLLQFFCSIVILGFVSCNKPETDLPVTTDQTQLLVKAVGLDSTLSAPFDTLYRAFYFYDDNRRPVLTTSLTNDKYGDSLYYSEKKYFYTGGVNTAFKTIEESRYFSTVIISDLTASYYFYDNAGRLLKDSTSFKSSNGNITIYLKNYSYVGNNIIYKYGTSNDGRNISTEQSTIYQTFSSNGDITHQIDTSILRSGNSVLYSRNEHTAEYLPNFNPLATVVNATRRPDLGDDFGLGSEAGPNYLFSKTQLSKKSWGSATGGGQSSVSYQYEFRNDGLPIIINDIPSTGRQIKYLLYYK